jgi:serine/threonine-protein kinase
MDPHANDADALVGRSLGGRYRIERAMARGGMATVYRARDERLERPVAVKVLAARYADQPGFSERFLAEARIAASLSHPNLAHVYDSGRDAGLSFMVLEVLDRHRSVRSVLRDQGRLAPGRAVQVGLDVLAGLEPLHASGLVHCDIKPGNVMVGPDGTKLIDFGIARPLDGEASGSTSIGSLHAMSPEQLRGQPLTPASDLFAVGVLLYECLTGRVPFAGSSPGEVLDAQQRGLPPAPSALAEGIVQLLDEVVLQALRTEPARRFTSAAAMATALRSAADAQATDSPAGGTATGDDETTAIRLVVPRPASELGPPPPDPPTKHRRATPATALAWLAAAAVPLLVAGIVVLGSDGATGGGPGTSPSPEAESTPTAQETLAPGMVRVPDTIGMTEAQAEAAARAAGLAWRIEWRVVPGQTPGIYAQDPEPGTVVRQGARFVMQAYRSR